MEATENTTEKEATETKEVKENRVKETEEVNHSFSCRGD